MIVVDTSVWINALRSRECEEGRHLTELLDADQVAIAIPVRLEILSGSQRSQQTQLSRTLSALPLIYPAEPTWRVDRGMARCDQECRRLVRDALKRGIFLSSSPSGRGLR